MSTDDGRTLSEIAKSRGITPEEFIGLLEPIDGWPHDFDPLGHGRVACVSGPLHAREDVLTDVLRRCMSAGGLDDAPAGILREGNRKTLYVQEPNSWRG
jgi:hypothetical protein